MDTTLFQHIFESSIEGILVVNDKGKIIKANSASEQTFGYRQGELQSLEIEALIPQKHRDIHKVHRNKYAKRPTTRHSGILNNLIGLKKDGTEFPIDISLSPTVVKGENLTIAFLRDVSEKSEVAQSLFESERKLSTLIGNLPGFVYRTRNDKNYTAEYFSIGCDKITGYKNTEFTKGNISLGQIILEKDREYVLNTIQKAIKNKKPFSLHMRILTKTGEIKYIWEQGEVIFDNNGDVVALEGFIQDISDNVLLKKTLKRKEAKNKALLDALPDMMFITDVKGDVLEVHAPDPQKLIIPIDKIIGKNLIESLPTKVYQKLYSAIQDTFKSKRINTVNYNLIINKNNYYFEARLVPLNNHKILTIVRDVTYKKNIENKLEIKNRALSAAGNGILIVDAQKPDLPIIYTNTAFTKITGYKQSEMLGNNCRILQRNDRDQEEIKIMAKAIKEGELCQVVLRNYKKDGSLFYNELTITPVYNNNQELTHFIGVSNDVTKRKEEELLKSRIRNVLKMIAQEQILENIGDKIIEIIEDNTIDSTGLILLLNRDNKILHKVSTPNLLKDYYQMTEGVKILSEECPCSTVSLTGKEIIIEDLNGDIKWTKYKSAALKEGFKSSWSFPIFSSEKKVIGVFTLFGIYIKKPSFFELGIISSVVNLLSIAIEQDSIRQELYEGRKKLAAYTQDLEEKIQERTDDLKTTVQKLVETNLTLEDQIIETKLAEQKALDNHSLFSAIAKNFPKGVIAVVNSEDKLIFIDGNELSNFGLSNKNLQNVAIDDIDILNIDQKNAIKEGIKKTLSGDHLSFEINFKGQTYAVNTTPFYDVNKQIDKALFVYSNISEHKQVELEILNALRKEQELNELKSRFVSMASHEFRTPLSTILSSATLIERQNEVGKENKRLDYVSKIKSNVRNLVNILDDFLSLSTLEDGKLSLEAEIFNLIDFSINIIEEIGMSKKEGQTIELSYDMDKLKICQDPKIIRLIFNNLLSNAIKYSTENKSIKILISADNEQVYLQFKDQGIGIPHKDKDQLFDRFFRAKNANHVQGTGLGLYIVKQYTVLMGGTIYLKDNDTKGTTFVVQFPLNCKN